MAHPRWSRGIGKHGVCQEYGLPQYLLVLPFLYADRFTRAHVYWRRLHLSEEEVPRITQEVLARALPRVSE